MENHVMNKFCFVCLVYCMSYGYSEAAVIDFESFTPGTEVTNQLSGLGIEFSSDGIPGATQVTNILDMGGSSVLGPNGPAPYNGGTLFLEFSTPVYVVSSDLVNVKIVSIDIQLFDSASNLIDTISGTTSWSYISAVPVSRVQLDGHYFSNGTPNGWAIDNLSFSNVPAVPLPAAVWLLLSGLGVLTVTIGKNRVARNYSA
jgi:hypothetical protein